MVNPWRPDLDVLIAIWRDSYPPASPRQHSLIEKLLCTVTILIGFSSLSFIKKVVADRFGKSHLFMDIYVLLWAAVMSLTLFAGLRPTWIAVIVACYRVLDIVNYRVFFLLVKSQEKPWTEDVLRRSLVIAVVNFYEVVVGFAILYLHCDCVRQTGGDLGSLQGAVAAFYFSLVTMATVGYGDFVATTSVGRGLVIAQITSTIVFVLFLLPALVSVFSSSLTSRRAKDSN